jgi:hypothetical protein
VQGQGRPGQGDEQTRPRGDALLVLQTLGQRQGAPQTAFGVAEPADLVEVPGSSEELGDLVVRNLDGVA